MTLKIFLASRQIKKTHLKIKALQEQLTKNGKQKMND